MHLFMDEVTVHTVLSDELTVQFALRDEVTTLVLRDVITVEHACVFATEQD